MARTPIQETLYGEMAGAGRGSTRTTRSRPPRPITRPIVSRVTFRQDRRNGFTHQDTRLCKNDALERTTDASVFVVRCASLRPAHGRAPLKAPASVRAAEQFSRVRLSQSFFMRDFLY